MWFHQLFGKALFWNKGQWSSTGSNRLSSFKILSCQLGNDTKETCVTSGSAEFYTVKSKLGEVGLWAAASVGADVQLERTRRNPPYHVSVFKRSFGLTWTLLRALQLYTAPGYPWFLCGVSDTPKPSSPLETQQRILFSHDRSYMRLFYLKMLSAESCF